jgi:hypothetical protein
MASYVILFTQGTEIIRISSSKSVPSKYIMRSYLKNTQHKNRADRGAQVVEQLYTNHEVLSSNPTITKKLNEHSYNSIWVH